MNKQSDPLKVLEQLETVQERIDKLADDLYSGKDFFASIDGCDLLRLLEIHPEHDGNEWARTRYHSLRRLDEQEEPVTAFLDHLRGKIHADRYQLLEEEAERCEECGEEFEIELFPEEVRIIEVAITEEGLSDDFGGAFDVAERSLSATDGSDLYFQCDIGGGGECSDLLTPYDIRDDSVLPDDDAYVAGESW